MENRVNWLGPAIYSVMIGLFVAAFSQSCNVTKASIARYITPVKLHDIPIVILPQFKPQGLNLQDHMAIDSGKQKESPSEAKNKPDTMNYDRMILDNQKLSLTNENKILELLLRKENENKKLKQVNTILKEKSVITKDEKEDAISMKAIWDTGNKILALCAAILGLLILQNIGLFVYYRKQIKANERQTCKPR